MERGRAAFPPQGALRARLGVALIGLPALAALLALPDRAFLVALVLLAAVGAGELLRAAGGGAGVIASAAGASSALAAGLSSVDRGASAAALAVCVLVLAAALRAPASRRVSVLWWAAGVLYVGVLLVHVVLLRMEPEGQRWLVVLLAAVFATDTGAYAVGRPLGRHALAPQLSAGKTWEGAVGGLLAGALATLGAAWVLDLAGDGGASLLPELAAVALALPVAAHGGDLLASAIKRRLGRKDFSRLLPGHGGLLDRMDSILLAGPTLYWLLVWAT